MSLTGANQDIRGSTTFNNLQKNTNAAVQMNFESGGVLQVNGMFTLTGQSGKLLTISAVPFQPYAMVNPVGGTTLSFLKLYYVANQNGTISCASNCYLGKNSPGWSGLLASGGSTMMASEAAMGAAAIGSAPSYKLSGVVTYLGPGLPGVVLDSGNANIGTTTTDQNGYYEFANLASGTPFTLKLSKEGFSFFPTDVMSGVMSSDRSYYYNAAVERYDISGVMLLGGSPLAGVLIDGGELGKIVTNDTGGFTFPKLYYGTPWSVRPVLSGYRFSPSSASGILAGEVDLIFNAGAGVNPTPSATPTKHPQSSGTPSMAPTPNGSSTPGSTPAFTPTPGSNPAQPSPTATYNPANPTPAVTASPSPSGGPVPVPWGLYCKFFLGGLPAPTATPK